MADIPNVELGSKNNFKSQWSKSLFFQKEGHKLVPKKKALFALAVIMVLSSYFFVSIFQAEVVFKERMKRVSAPENSKIISLKSLLVFESPKAEKKSVKKTKRKTRKEISLFTPLRLISRTLKFDIPDGHRVKARLGRTVINGTLAEAFLTSPVIVDDVVVFPKGTKLLGTTRENRGRVAIDFKRAYLPESKKPIKVTAQAIRSKDGSFGLPAQVAGKRINAALASTGLYFINGFSQGLVKKNVSGEHVFSEASMKNALLMGAGQASLEQSRQMLSGLKNKKSILKVPKGRRFHVLFQSKQDWED